jgi:hypothetical protein
MPQGMNRVHRLVVGIAGVILLLWVGLSWGGPPNPTPSDPQGNTAGGFEALLHNTTGYFNTAFGARALWNNTHGVRNTASGANTLSSNTTGVANTASGANTLSSNTTGNNNTASGVGALEDNTDGSFNTASGGFALVHNTIGYFNTAFGGGALQNNTIGTNNIAIGASAGSNLSSGNHNIYLGHPGASSESNTMRLGADGTHTRTFIAGIAGTPLPGSTVVIDAAGQLGILPSSARYKHDIHDMGERSRALFQLRPVTFRYTQDSQGVWQYGLIAEEVAAVYPELVVRGTDGTVEAVQYHELIPLLLNEIQRQQQELAGQAWQLAELQAQHARLQAVVVQLQERDEAQRAQYAAMAAHLARLEEAVRVAPRASR